MLKYKYVHTIRTSNTEIVGKRHGNRDAPRQFSHSGFGDMNEYDFIRFVVIYSFIRFMYRRVLWI